MSFADYHASWRLETSRRTSSLGTAHSPTPQSPTPPPTASSPQPLARAETPAPGQWPAALHSPSLSCLCSPWESATRLLSSLPQRARQAPWPRLAQPCWEPRLLSRLGEWEESWRARLFPVCAARPPLAAPRDIFDPAAVGNPAPEAEGFNPF